MTELSKLDATISTIRGGFSGIIGARVVFYETAELLLLDDSWSPWADLPIRLFTDTNRLVSVSWSRFDDLWVALDTSLPFSVEGSTVRWVKNAVPKINPVIGAIIRDVSLGQGQMSIEGKEMEIWTRLLIDVDRGWLEIFNALDENGYDFHLQRPSGSFVPCMR